MASKETIQKVFTMLEAAYHVEHSDDTLAVHIQFLADVPDHYLELAAFDHVKMNKWFPAISELRQRAFFLIPGGESGAYMFAYLAFGEDAANKTLAAPARKMLESGQ